MPGGCSPSVDPTGYVVGRSMLTGLNTCSTIELVIGGALGGRSGAMLHTRWAQPPEDPSDAVPQPSS